MARETIESFGGSVAKFIGDGVMALFGVPEIAEDDADRAVAAGLALQRGFTPIRDRVAERHGIELGLRVGVNTGELVLSGGDTDVVGDAVNTAARLEAAVPTGRRAGGRGDVEAHPRSRPLRGARRGRRQGQGRAGRHLPRRRRRDRGGGSGDPVRRPLRGALATPGRVRHGGRSAYRSAGDRHRLARSGQNPHLARVR